MSALERIPSAGELRERFLRALHEAKDVRETLLTKITIMRHVNSDDPAIAQLVEAEKNVSRVIEQAHDMNMDVATPAEVLSLCMELRRVVGEIRMQLVRR